MHRSIEGFFMVVALSGREELVKAWRDGPIARISLNRPEKRNAKNLALINQLHDAVAGADADPEVRVIVISGEGPSFSSGHDVSQVDHDPEVLALYNTPEARLHTERSMYLEKSLAIRNTRKPTIAQVHGHCIAAGMMTAAMCDLVVASDDAKFGMPVLARYAAVGEILFEVWEIGARRAKEFLFTGEIIDAQRAMELGFVNRVVPRADLDREVRDLALKIASQPPVCLELTKASINRTLDMMGQRNAYEYHFMAHVFSHFTEEAETERARRKSGGPKKPAKLA
jgi:enoyl-CoA hydratase